MSDTRSMEHKTTTKGTGDNMQTSTITSKAASSAGALPGHVATCSCGYSQGSSLGEREAKILGFAHKAWAEKAGK